MSNKQIKSIRGFSDVLPKDTAVWNFILDQLKAVLHSHAIKEIKTPYVEETALFARGVGEATDIVEKEMFAVDSKSEDKAYSLRPEGTAGAIRAAIENGMVYNQEQRLYYYGPMFRYERPQKGRLRQFNQLGVEVLGIKNPALDAEVILMVKEFWDRLGLSEVVHLEINTIGTAEARREFGQALVNYLTPLKDQLDEDSQRRLDSNPLRILDSKDANTQALLVNAPKLEDYISAEDQQYFADCLALLEAAGCKYSVNRNLVRGLDYYNDVVFEWVTDKLGAQATICGGGRYDKLVELLGGHSCPGFGFGLGFERLVLLYEEVLGKPELAELDAFLIAEPEFLKDSFTIAKTLRDGVPSLSLINNLANGKFKKQFSKADKFGAKLVIILGREFGEEKLIGVKNLKTGEQEFVALDNLVTTVVKQLNK